MNTKKKQGLGTNRSILIVDDDPQVREVFSELLRQVGYQVESAENALAAIASVVRGAPQLILMDLRMPVVGGTDLIRELKSHVDSRRIPIVAFTGYDSPAMREAAMQAGCDYYLPKPIDPGPFLDEIDKIFRTLTEAARSSSPRVVAR